MKEGLPRRKIPEHWGWKAVDEEDSRLKRIIPEVRRDSSLRHQSETGLDDVTVFAFGNTVLKGRVWTGDTLMNPCGLEILTKHDGEKFWSAITLDGLKTTLKLVLDKFVEGGKNGEKLRASLKSVKPSKAGKIVNKTNIKFIFIKGLN